MIWVSLCFYESFYFIEKAKRESFSLIEWDYEHCLSLVESLKKEIKRVGGLWVYKQEVVEEIETLKKDKTKLEGIFFF